MKNLTELQARQQRLAYLILFANESRKLQYIEEKAKIEKQIEAKTKVNKNQATIDELEVLLASLTAIEEPTEEQVAGIEAIKAEIEDLKNKKVGSGDSKPTKRGSTVLGWELTKGDYKLTNEGEDVHFAKLCTRICGSAKKEDIETFVRQKYPLSKETTNDKVLTPMVNTKLKNYILSQGFKLTVKTSLGDWEAKVSTK